jgi:Uncharacterized protein conserved in bacteria (DUF2188)
VNKDQLYVERRDQGDYAVRRANSQRASAVLPTQAQAIERAKELNPNRRPVVERVRNTTAGGRDKWRRA